MTPAALERLPIEGPSGSLEAVAEDPAVAADRYGIVCHPHPLFGGTMDNKVVTSVARALQETGMPTVRFNFRGVGASEGVFDSGIGETADADAIAAWGGARWPGRRPPLFAGFSFGAYVALRLAQVRRPSQLITVAPPLAHFDFSGMTVPDCPWLVVQGDADDVVDPRGVISWVKGMNPQPQLLILPGAGHFFHGRLHELREAVIDAVRRG